MNTPKVAVLMPVYNGEKYLATAIESVLKQTFEDFEFIIINDGSTDSSVRIIESYNDPRIKLIYNKENIKIVRSLNRGLELAAGKYIARMDYDDIMAPNRLTRQVECLDANPFLQVIGSWWYNIDSFGAVTGIQKLPEAPFECDFWFYLLGEQPVGHPCAMFRRETALALGGYHESYIYAEDAEFWFRFVMNGYKFSNIKEPLMFYRSHNLQKTKQSDQLTEDDHNKALAVFMSRELGYNVFPEEAGLYRHSHLSIQSSDDLIKVISLKQKMAEKYFDNQKLKNKDAAAVMAKIFFSLLALVKLEYMNSALILLKIDTMCRKLLLKQIKANNVSRLGYIIRYYCTVAIQCLKVLAGRNVHVYFD